MVLRPFLEFVSKATAALTSRRGPSKSQRQLIDALGGVNTFSGWTGNRHEEILHYRGWAFIAISALARELADTQPKCGRAAAKAQPEKRLRRGLLAKALSPVADADTEFELYDDDHPLPALFADPNEPDTGYHLWFETVLWLSLTGNAYWWCPRGPLTPLTGLPGELWVLPSQWVTPNYKGTGKWVDSYTLRSGRAGHVLELDADDVIHFRYSHPWDKRDGYGPLRAGSHWIDIENSLSRSRLAAFKNAMRPSIGIELDEKIDPNPLDKTIDRIYAQWDAKFAGEHNHGRPVISAPGSKLVNLSTFSPNEMAFLESDSQIRDTVLSLFGVPYPVANIVGGATFENADAAIRNFYQRTLNPLRRFIGGVVTEKLAKRHDENARVFWIDDSPADPEQERKNNESCFDRGGLTPNEYRQCCGKEPSDDPNADKLYILSGYVPLEDASMPEPTEADGAFGGNPPAEDKPEPEGKPAKSAWWNARNGCLPVNGDH